MTHTIRGTCTFQHGFIGVQWVDKTKFEGIDGRWFTPANDDVRRDAVMSMGREVEVTFTDADSGAEHATAISVQKV